MRSAPPGCGHKEFKRPPGPAAGTARDYSTTFAAACKDCKTANASLTCYHSGQPKGKWKKDQAVKENPRRTRKGGSRCWLPPLVGRLGYRRLDYWSGIPGSTGVPSTRTAFRAEGAIPRALRMVGATWAVPTGALTVRGWKPGNDTSSMTLVSSWENPPCSSSFEVLPEYVTPTFGVTMMSGVRGSLVGLLKFNASDGP